ncbi:hypothetical protein PT974_05410 [Cladobotryum mycophilum]|uniref:Uncharacterized protein n=1 Tax=Cladobotryum mycophilum TaxID=491253 RepID=A0ABR0SJ17_9HYPO
MSIPGISVQPFMSNREAIHLFNYAKTDHSEIQLENDADLNVDAVRDMAISIFGPGIRVTTVSTDAEPDGFHVSYRIDAGLAVLGSIDLDIQTVRDTSTAQAALKAPLSLITAPLHSVAMRSVEPLDQASLQLGSSLVWVRDALLLKVDTNDSTPFLEIRADLGKLRRKAQNLLHLGGVLQRISPYWWPQRPSRSILTPLITAFAIAMDNHIKHHAVLPLYQTKADTAVEQPSYTVPVGKDFTIKLANDSDTHTLKPSLTSDYKVVRPMGNGTVNGYPFRSFSIGKTTVTLIVVHAHTLVVGAVEVDVEVTEWGDVDEERVSYHGRYFRPGYGYSNALLASWMVLF